MRKGFRITIMVVLLAIIVMSGYLYIEKENDMHVAKLNAIGNVEDRPTLIIGDDMNYPPYSYLDSSGNPQGFSLELIQEAANVMGYNVVFKLDEWNNVRRSLEDGSIDAVAGMFYSKTREDKYSFSTRHSITNGDVFTRSGEVVKSVYGLRGKTVVVQDGDIVYEYLKEQGIDIDFIKVPTVSEALQLVSEGKYDYAAVLNVPGHYIIKEEKIRNIKSQGLYLAPKDYCMAVSKDNEDLLLVLNSGLYILKSTGKYQQIYDKWLGVYDRKSFVDVLKDYSIVVFSVFLVILILMVWSILLRSMVNSRTKELQESNEEIRRSKEELNDSHQEIEASMEELIAIEEELREQYERLLSSEENLKLSEERNRAIINAIPDILFILSSDGEFLDSKESDEKRLFLPTDMFIGKKLIEVLPEEIAIQGMSKITKALENNNVETFEYSIVLNDELKYFEMRLVKSKENEVLAITRDITDQKQNQLYIEYLSYHDQLTGLFNRRYFEEELEKLDHEGKLPLTLVMADVNGLKLVNDSFGHRFGDLLLVKVAEVLKNYCQNGEIISRIGGDEFVILLPKTNENEAEKFVNNLKQVSEAEKLSSIDLSISFGWMTKYDTDEDIHEIFNKAEDFMYKKKLFEGPSMRGKTIGAIINTLHEKNKREEQHSQRVSYYCAEFAKVLNLSETDIQELTTAGLLHDIGKIAIHEYLLNKPGKLTEEEREEVQKHPEIGYRILSSVNDMSEMAEYVLAHHERWDGTGYPKGMKGLDIPLQARIIAIVDSFDAMTSERSYRSALSDEHAIMEIRKNSGTQFDPELVKIFVDEVI